MKKKLFKELCESIRQAGKIRRGEMKPSREFIVAMGKIIEVVENTKDFDMSKVKEGSLWE